MNILHTNDSETFIQRINQLSESSQRLWGKMTVSQMIEHCTRPFQVALGELKLQKTLVGILFGGIAKRSFLKGKPMSKNLPTAKSFIVSDNPALENTKKKLLDYIDKFRKMDKNELETRVHPFFGKMTADEWGKLFALHLDHHLRQFGA
ncbi:MAG: DUF1569 domain-containing protein [Raineya sp.]|jgi:hypothetical protein|nr:DUF1569 domain-containing protein [Raineya sp.]